MTNILEMDTDDECCVCMEVYSSKNTSAVPSNCVHDLCLKCLLRIGDYSGTFQCPTCRTISYSFRLKFVEDPIDFPSYKKSNNDELVDEGFESQLEDWEDFFYENEPQLNWGPDNDDDDEQTEADDNSHLMYPLPSANLRNPLCVEIDYDCWRLDNTTLEHVDLFTLKPLIVDE